jgi:hypothetical protein
LLGLFLLLFYFYIGKEYSDILYTIVRYPILHFSLINQDVLTPTLRNAAPATASTIESHHFGTEVNLLFEAFISYDSV